MASDLTKWADHAIALVRHGEGLLTSLYAAKQVLDGVEEVGSQDIIFRGGPLDVPFTFRGVSIPCEVPPRPPLEKIRAFVDPGIWNLSKQVIRKFPDFGDLGKNVTSLSSNAADIVRELKPFYDLFVAVTDYVDLAAPLVLATSKFYKMDPQLNPDVVTLFLDLLVNIVSVVHTFASEIGPTKKLVLFSYYRAYQVNNAGAECADWYRVTTFTTQYEKTWPALAETFLPISGRIISTLQSLRPELKVAFSSSGSALRSTGLFSIHSNSPSQATDVDIRWLGSLTRSSMLFKAVFFGFLVAPLEALAQSGSVDVLKAAMTFGYLPYPVRNHFVSAMNEADALAKSTSKASKIKSAIHEAVNTASTSVHAFHRERRDFVRFQLRQFSPLSEDFGQLIEHFNVITTELGLAKEEIMWYFGHYDRDGTGKRKGRKDAKYLDITVFGLVAHLVRFRIQLVKHQSHILSGLVEKAMNDHSLDAILSCLDQLMQERNLHREAPGLLIQSLQESLLALKGGDASKLLVSTEARGIALNWKRIQVVAALNPELMNANAYRDLVTVFTNKWFENYEQRVMEIASLKELFFFQGSLLEHLREIMESESDYTRHLGVLGSLGVDFLDNATTFWPMEYGWITTHTISFLTEVYSIAGQYAAFNVHQFAINSISLANQLHASEIVGLLPKSVANDKKKNAAKKVEKVLVKPGQESHMDLTDNDIQALFWLKSNVRHILHALKVVDTVTIHDLEFCPFEFFLDAYTKMFKTYVNQNVYKSEYLVPKDHPGPSGEDMMSFELKRPSVALGELESYLATVKCVDGIGNTDILVALRDVLVEVTDLDSLRLFAAEQPDGLVFQFKNKIVREKGKAVIINFHHSFVVTYVMWYSEFLCTKAITLPTIYSPQFDEFCNVNPSTTQAELYTHPKEMEALVELIGLQGVQFMEEKLTRILTLHAAAAHEMIQQNLEVFENLKKNSNDVLVMRDSLRKVRLMRDFVAKAVTVGYIQKFRKALNKAVQKRFSKKAPEVFDMIETLHSMYPPTIQSSDKFKLGDALANHVGLTGRFDGMARWALSALSNPDANWQYLPQLFAVTYWFLMFDDTTKYVNQFDGITNNSHCLAEAFFFLVQHMLPLTKSGAKELIPEYHRDCLRLAIAGMYANTQPALGKEGTPGSLDAVILLLHKFANESIHITSDMFESWIAQAVVQKALDKAYWKPHEQTKREDE